jgi:integrase
MLFAGVRPHETARLDWADIDMEEGNVLVRNTKAKTDRSRYFQMPDTLKAWLEVVPEEEREGSIVPPSWKRVIGLIRKKAGISEERDVLRKTFATAHLGYFKDVNLTRSIMGHEVGDVLFQHYRGLMKPKDARAFWEILPRNENMNTIEE